MSEPSLTAATPVGVRALRENLSDYLRRAHEGAAFLVMSRGKAVAELRAPTAQIKTPRQPDLLAGRITMAEDFDVTADDLIDAMEGRSE